MWRAALILMLCVLGALSEAGNAGPFSVDELSGNLTWRRLLHFLPGANKSDISEKDFFISPTGSIDPRAELAANIDKLENENGEEEERFSCRFPARTRFIRAHFAIKATRPCPHYEAWRSRAEPDAIIFVHASQFIGNPASAFGHSFIRFDRDHHAGLLGFALSYFAKTDHSDNFLAYAFKGINGGYTGEYQFDHYYPKVHGYAGVENRDLWEFELKLNKGERQIIFEHAWELVLAGRTPYYFLNRNCTYQLLRLIEVANESFELASQASGAFLTPVGSLKILDKAGLIQKSTYRPSMRQQALAKVELLDRKQEYELRGALNGRLAPESITDPHISSALVATLAMNELSGSSAEMKGLFNRATEARAKLPVTSAVKMNLKSAEDWNPLNSHSSLQANVGVFSQKGEGVLQFGVRPSLHALDDFAAGYLPNTQLVFLNTEFRSDNEKGMRLHKLDLLDIKSLRPVSTINQGISWTTYLGLESLRANACEDCQQLRTAAAFGYAANFSSRWIGYALGGPTLDVLRPFERAEVRLGPSLSLGTVSNSFRNFVLRFEEKLDYFALTPFAQELILTTEGIVSYHLTRDSMFSIMGSQKRNLAGDQNSDTEFGLRFSENF